MTKYKEDEGFCLECSKMVLIKKRRVNHALHLIISLITFGLWWPVWLILTLVVNKRSVWKCSQCGTEIALSQNKEILNDPVESVKIKPVKSVKSEPVKNEHDVATKMKQLKELFDEGILTEEELKSKKKELLEQF